MVPTTFNAFYYIYIQFVEFHRFSPQNAENGSVWVEYCSLEVTVWSGVVWMTVIPSVLRPAHTKENNCNDKDAVLNTVLNVKE